MRGAKFDVSPLLLMLYDDLQNAMQNATHRSKMQHYLLGGTFSSPYISRLKNIFDFGTGSASLYGIRKRELKMEKIKITENTSALVRNGKVIYLIQNGKITQDPLKVRYFQRMI